MKDRVPALGKANRVKITQDNGQIVEGVLSYADEAIEEGSAWNKANVLPDDVVAYLGLEQSNPQPKDAFLAVADAVGDIKTTVRTDLGDDWLLCNGMPYDPTVYPDLITDVGFSVQSGINQHYKKLIATNDDGSVVAVMQSSGTNVYVDYTTDITSGQWSTTSLSSTMELTAVAYGNGKWVMVGWSSNTPIILTASTPSGPWKTQNPTSSESRVRLVGVCFNGTVWKAIGHARTSGGTNYGIVVYTAADPSGTWTASSPYITTDSNETSCGIYYFGGVWLIPTYNTITKVYVSSDGTNWTSKTVSGLYGSQLQGCIYDKTNFGVYSSSKLFTTTDPLGTWSETTPPTEFSKYTVYNDKVYAFTSKGVIYASESMILPLNNIGSLVGTNIAVYDVNSNSQFLIVTTTDYVNSQYLPRYYVAPKLPLISLDGAYAYIRAK